MVERFKARGPFLLYEFCIMGGKSRNRIHARTDSIMMEKKVVLIETWCCWLQKEIMSVLLPFSV